MSETKFKYIGKRMTRTEDPRILTGQAPYVGDVNLPGMLHGFFLRSDYAFAKINSIDYSEALKIPGVVGIYTAEDMGDFWKPGPQLVPAPTVIPGTIFNRRTQVPLAKDYVRHQGEPIAFIVAETRYIAEDAAAEIIVDLEPLDPVVDLATALDPETPLIYPELGTNLASYVKQEVGSWEEAKKQADFVLGARFDIDRCIGGALETRAYVANWDEREQFLTFWATTQSPINIRNGLAAMFGLSESQVRVIAPFVGGGFGPKVMMFQPEEVLTCWTSMKLKRPVKYVLDRQEEFLATTQERRQIHDAEIAFTKDGKVLGVKDNFLHETGAFNSYALTIPLNTQTHILGPYKIPNFSSEFKVAFTNKILVTPVRAAGRSFGTIVMERLMDMAAEKLGMDKMEIRRRNLLHPEDLPYETHIVGQDFIKNVLDSGDYPAALEKALEMIEYDKFINEVQPKLRAEGKLVGIGVAMFTEGTAVGPYEGARVTVEATGKVTVVTGYASQGQAHFTTLAQIAGEVLGINPRDIRVTTGDTGKFHWGAGTFASRGITLVGTAVYNASVKVKAKILEMASQVLNTPVEELELEDGFVRVADIPSQCVALTDLAVRANPARGNFEAGTDPGLEVTAYYGPPHGATGYGACAMIVEVDPGTFQVKIQKLCFVHDCGTVINPLVVDGQVHGALSMGVGNSFFEKLVYDETTGQLQNSTFTDYMMVRATDLPTLELGHLEVPSPLNPLGIKGVGEAGAIPTPAAFVQAVENALEPVCKLRITQIPTSPDLLYKLAKESGCDLV